MQSSRGRGGTERRSPAPAQSLFSDVVVINACDVIYGDSCSSGCDMRKSSIERSGT